LDPALNCTEICQQQFDSCTGNLFLPFAVCVASFSLCQSFCDTPPIVPDCNGDCGGTAYTNDCGLCVGGNTGLPD
jgi:hypothetical protein